MAPLSDSFATRPDRRRSRLIRGLSRAGGAFLLVLAFPRDALAYIDPITGSIVLQILAAGVLAITITGKRVRDRASTLVRRLLRRPEH